MLLNHVTLGIKQAKTPNGIATTWSIQFEHTKLVTLIHESNVPIQLPNKLNTNQLLIMLTRYNIGDQAKYKPTANYLNKV